MATAKVDPAVQAHLEWLGFVRPTGLVVSAPALVRAGAILDRRDTEGQRLLKVCVEGASAARAQVSDDVSRHDASTDPEPVLRDFRTFAESVLGWSFSIKGYAGTLERPIPAELEVPLPDYDETLRPDFAVREPDEHEGTRTWQLLVQVLEPDCDFDCATPDGGPLDASAHSRMERMLRATGVPAGLLFNGRLLRLLSAPHGESSGWLDFRVADMVQPAGRPISTALRLLLGQPRLLSLPRKQRLAALLDESRKFQNEVSERLAEQVLHALYELLRGFQAAHDASKGELLRQPLSDHPDEVYRALLTVVLRLVFLLYAEERGMLSDDEPFGRHYSLASLHERLREDAALFPDTMEQRYGAWAQLLVLFRMVHDGAEASALHLPRREGVLFDPDRFAFLEGCHSFPANAQRTERIEPPLVPDGTIYRALEKLLVLDGERISYRALDVEQIGSVYETMMGFRLETTAGPGIAIKAQKKQGAPTVVNLEALLREDPARRSKWLRERTDRKLTEKISDAVKAAEALEDLHAALLPVIDSAATPDIVPKGAMVLQPSEARRRSGSHYTPRSLTKPIVQTTLDPILTRLRGKGGQPPHPEQILDIKVCDPAMGSGAFLVEACRQLGDALVEAWHSHNAAPKVSLAEDEVVLARRLVAQRCLYGVDRNPVAVDLARVSLWLTTLAKDESLTFLDHALRHGDSLVGLSRKQLEAFHWEGDVPPFQRGLEAMRVDEHLKNVARLRQRIRALADSASDRERKRLWEELEAELDIVRLFGDLVLLAYFEGENEGQRKAKRDEYAGAVSSGDIAELSKRVGEMRHANPSLVPFHWEIEFTEVFDRVKPGFDAIVGNPPYAGKNSVADGNQQGYPDWLKQIHEESHGNADLVAHFFRRAFQCLREDGTFGLIATNTIAQGDTRSTGLRWICSNGGDIYCARKRVRWPGRAAVVVSVVHVSKGRIADIKRLDDRGVTKITAFLSHRGGNDDPRRLGANDGKSFQGSIILGMGFTFDDQDKKGVATPLTEMRRLIEANSVNQKVILPFIGGEELNTAPTHQHHRHVINFGERRETECRTQWPELLEIVERKVKPERTRLTSNAIGRKRAQYWWHYGSPAKELYSAIGDLEQVLAISQVTSHVQFAFLPSQMVFAHTLNVFALSTYAAFCALQSRLHEIWARFFGSSMKDDLRYTPSDCFETFPFPDSWETHASLESAGSAYYGFRAQLMLKNNEGLTKTYNRFHDPNESDPGIPKLRELHAAMDRAVLNAYGWTDIPTDCEFILDYEIDEQEWRNRKKPYRYRWPGDVRDEVLGRLLELNAERAKEEARAGVAAAAQRRGDSAARRPTTDQKPSTHLRNRAPAAQAQRREPRRATQSNPNSQRPRTDKVSAAKSRRSSTRRQKR